MRKIVNGYHRLALHSGRKDVLAMKNVRLQFTKYRRQSKGDADNGILRNTDPLESFIHPDQRGSMRVGIKEGVAVGAVIFC